jgi:hypothetical protein
MKSTAQRVGFTSSGNRTTSTNMLDAVLALVSETEVEDYLSISSNDSFLILYDKPPSV